MGSIVLEHVSKEFPGGVQAVRDVSLEIEDGEFMVLVGPSGCGKTTILRMIAGLDEVTGGEISIGDRVVTDEKPKDRDIAMVFQNYALYPHMTVEQNIGFGMRLRRTPKTEMKQRVGGAAQVLALLDYLARKPADLSGGQRQRVAIGRAMVREPKAFLMDEPLSNLDAKLRVQMRAEIARLQADLGVTTVYVTHDQVEAMTMGDRVAVMRKGELQQVATPQELYDHPLNLFVGGFIGSPAMNLLEAKLDADGVHVDGQTLALPEELNRARPALASYVGRDLIVGLRPEHLEDASVGHGGSGRLRGAVRLVEALGSEVMAHLDVQARPARTDEVRELAEDVGTSAPTEEQSHAAVVGRFNARSKARPGDTIEIAVDTGAMHFFDPQTGLGIYDEGAPS